MPSDDGANSGKAPMICLTAVDTPTAATAELLSLSRRLGWPDHSVTYR